MKAKMNRKIEIPLAHLLASASIMTPIYHVIAQQLLGRTIDFLWGAVCSLILMVSAMIVLEIERRLKP